MARSHVIVGAACAVVASALGASAATTLAWSAILRQDAAWYATAEAAELAAQVMRYQAPSGGWPKNTDMTRAPAADVLDGIAAGKSGTYAATIDNGATTTPLTLLAHVQAAASVPDAALRESIRRGVDYLLAAQYESGGWPQFYPLRSGYAARVTFNDDAMVNVLGLLRAVARGEAPWGDLGEARRERAAEAVARGVEFILRAQVRVDGTLTAWCAQHDETTHAPAAARSFEPVSLSGSESVGITRFLMGIENPSPEVRAAVHAAVEWLEQVAMRGYRAERVRDAEGRYVDLVLVADPAARVWARFYELGTNRPIFVGRDGVVRYDLAEVEQERRAGYAYYGVWAERLLARDYPAWRREELDL
jgi:PelA/Pel-15E family pectate lyase